MRVDRLLEHPVVEEARGAIAVAVHRDEPHHARRRIERLRQPARVAGDFSAVGALDMPPLSRAMGPRPREGSWPRTMTGGCACGRVRYTAQRSHDDEAYLCHCRMCQRATGSVSIAFKNVKQADVELGAASPTGTTARRSRMRPYCRECGTSFGFKFKEGSGNMDLTVASFDDPSRFKPKHHFGAESMHRAWLNTEGLPEMRTDGISAAGRQMGRRDRARFPG